MLPEFPLLSLPEAVRGAPSDSLHRPLPPATPNRARQGDRLGQRFARLRRLSKADGALSLRQDPFGIAPERALVFDVAGGVPDIHSAVRRIEGLEFLGDEGIDFAPDKDFFIRDTRKGKEGHPRTDRTVGARLYLAMPDVIALKNLLSLWDEWQKRGSLKRPFGVWATLFERLRDIRAWGPRDRLSEETISVWRDEVADSAEKVRRIEVELWYGHSPRKREVAFRRVTEAVAEAGGAIIHRAEIAAIRYIAALVDLPMREMRRLATRKEIHLLICDEVMFLRPQSSLDLPDTAAEERESTTISPLPFRSKALPPVAALLDGVPVQNHALLRDRIEVDDPGELEAMSVVAARTHGTAMASLIVHGDQSLNEEPIRRKLLVRPVLYGEEAGAQERFPPDRLVLDVIYRAVLRMKDGEGDQDASAPEVFLVNLSLGDTHRPFAGLLSPWARLLDYLADRFGILFLVSAGNVRRPVPIQNIVDWPDFKDADAVHRKRTVLRALHGDTAHRSLLSPAEAVNVVTVGAQHHDAWTGSRGAAVDPYDGNDFPNLTSAQGLGHRRAIKPDICMPGGRELVTFASLAAPLSIRAASGRYGLVAAAPDPTGSLDREQATKGTSAAAALATRACHRIFDTLMNASGGSSHADMDRRFWPVVVKALLIHSAKWGEDADLLGALFGPQGTGKHVERRDNIARFLGYGIPRVDEVLGCTENRATLAGYGTIGGGQTNIHRIPLPPSLERITDPRFLAITVAWISPTNPNHQEYRRAKLEVGTTDALRDALGVSRIPRQPDGHSVVRGTVFHERYGGRRAVGFVDDGHLSLRVFCRERGGRLDQTVRYGVAVTIEAGEGVPVYREVRSRLAAGVRTGAGS